MQLHPWGGSWRSALGTRALGAALALSWIAPTAANPVSDARMTSPAALLSVVRTNYQGWVDSLWVRHDHAEVIIVPAIGRIMQFRRPGQESPFWENARLFGRAPDPTNAQWGNFGGDKTWPAPQADWPKVTPRAWPPPVAFDSLPVEATIQSNRVVLTSPVDPHYGIRTRRTIELLPHQPTLRVTTRYEKVSGDPQPVSVWIITQLRDPVAVFAPLPEPSPLPRPYVRQSPGTPLDLKLEGRLLSLRRSPKTSEKIGTASSALLWVGREQMLLIESPRSEGAEYPDEGSSAEVYTNSDPDTYVELELLGPLQNLRGGETLERTSLYTLLPRRSPEPATDARSALAGFLTVGAAGR